MSNEGVVLTMSPFNNLPPPETVPTSDVVEENNPQTNPERLRFDYLAILAVTIAFFLILVLRMR